MQPYIINVTEQCNVHSMTKDLGTPDHHFDMFFLNIPFQI